METALQQIIEKPWNQLTDSEKLTLLIEHLVKSNRKDEDSSDIMKSDTYGKNYPSHDSLGTFFQFYKVFDEPSQNH